MEDRSKSSKPIGWVGLLVVTGMMLLPIIVWEYYHERKLAGPPEPAEIVEQKLVDSWLRQPGQVFWRSTGTVVGHSLLCDEGRFHVEVRDERGNLYVMHSQELFEHVERGQSVTIEDSTNGLTYFNRIPTAEYCAEGPDCERPEHLPDIF